MRAALTFLSTALLIGACRRPSEPQATVSPEAASAAPAASSAPRVQERPALLVPAGQTYRVAADAGSPRPLLVVLHGLGGSGRLMFDAFRLAQFGAAEQLNIVAPDGNRDSAGRRFWDAGPACCNFDGQPIDDVARVSKLIHSWSELPGVDRRKVYVIGFSNGGFLAHRLACALGDELAGAVSLAGAVAGDISECRPNPALVLLHVHGDADDKVSYQGGRVFEDPRLGRHLSAEQGLRAWSRWLGCTGAIAPGPPLELEAAISGAETSTRAATGCPAGRAALWTVRGAGHHIGDPSRLLREIWSYLSSPPRGRAVP